MKKLTALILCMVLVACTACAKTSTVETEAPKSEPAATVEETKAPETTAPETTEAETEQAGPAATEQELTEYNENPALLHPTITRFHNGAQDAENKILFTSEYPQVELTEEEAKKYPELETALREDLNNYLSISADEAINTISDYLTDEAINSESFSPYFIKNAATVTRADENFFSVKIDESDYLGGAHPNSYTQAFTYKTSDGSLVTPADIFTDKDSLIKALTVKLKAIPDVDYFNLEGDLATYAFDSGYVADKTAFTMALTSDGAVFYFSPYELAPYAAGRQIVTLPYAEYATIMKPGVEYAAANYVYPADTYTDVFTKNGSFQIQTKYGEYENIIEIKFVTPDETFSFETFSYSAAPYVVQKGDKTFVYINQTGDDDVTFRQIFAVENGKVSLVKQEDTKIKSEFTMLEGTPVRDWNCYANKIKYITFCDPDKE